ncbi:MAG: DUF3267 domain-containing protein [Propionibacteriaceae bacterium]|nr:DUF3267 domain-containing protein [Propionibacteriaceae bacterium]
MTESAREWTTVEWTMEQLDTEAMAKQSLRWIAIGILGFGALGVVPMLRYDVIGGLLSTVLTFGAFLLVGIVVSTLLHEAAHGVVMARYGAKPQFGVGVLQGKVPYAYATAPGHKFTRRQFWWMGMMPTFVVNALFAVLVLFLPWGPFLVLPAALHLSACLGDWAILKMISQQPDGTLVEDTRAGLVLHLPPGTDAALN